MGYPFIFFINCSYRIKSLLVFLLMVFTTVLCIYPVVMAKAHQAPFKAIERFYLFPSLTPEKKLFTPVLPVVHILSLI